MASRHHLSRRDIRSLIEYLEGKNTGFNVTLEFSDPSENPELLELHRLVAIPALIKLEPSPKQIFAGTSIFDQVKCRPEYAESHGRYEKDTGSK